MVKHKNQPKRIKFAYNIENKKQSVRCSPFRLFRFNTEKFQYSFYTELPNLTNGIKLHIELCPSLVEITTSTDDMV